MLHPKFSILNTPWAPASFGLYGKAWLLAIVACGNIATFAFFAVLPNADNAVSFWFYDAGTCGDTSLCGGFSRAQNPFYEALRQVFYAMPFAILIAGLLINTAIIIKQKISFWNDLPLVTALISTLVLGPGVLVNVFFKEHILRSRPRDVSLFGGDFPFVPVGQWYGMCSGNCSFVSGEASIAPFMVLSILLLPKLWQKPAFLILFPASLAMALLRVVVGAHYLSDVMLGYGSTVLIFCLFAQMANRLTKTTA